MLSSVMLLSLAFAPVKLAAPGFKTVGVDAKLADVYLQRIVTLMKQPGLEVLTHNDVEALITLERQKQLLGCDGGGCVAEIAGALGAEDVLLGELAKTGKSLTLNLRVVRASDGQESVSTSVRVQSEDEVQDWIDANSRAFGRKIVVRERGLSDDGSGSGWIRWATLGLGVALGVGGGVTLGLAHSTADQASNPGAHETEAIASIVSRGRSFETTSFVLFGVAGAAIVTSVVLFLLPHDAPAVSFIATPQGAAFAFGGRF